MCTTFSAVVSAPVWLYTAIVLTHNIDDFFILVATVGIEFGTSWTLS